VALPVVRMWHYHMPPLVHTQEINTFHARKMYLENLYCAWPQLMVVDGKPMSKNPEKYVCSNIAQLNSNNAFVD